MKELAEAFVAGLAATTPLEAISVAAGLAYALLAVKRIRWCWLAGGVSSAILVYLAARGRLPMQAALQAYYVAMSFYGFWRWSKDRGSAARAVTTWPLRFHLIAWVVILALSAVSARWLAAETQAAWPFLDSVTTWASLLATWLVARTKLENWLYWIATDTVLVFLFLEQGMAFVASLFAAYLVISMFGFASWLRNYRQHAPVS
jgi:nicotinamide mononucleotide transporter